MKKGFSLIEVIAAIAIFSIGILAITLAFSTSLNVSKMNDVKRDTSQYAQVIAEKFNAIGSDFFKDNDQYLKMDIGNDNSIICNKYFDDLFDINSWFNGSKFNNDSADLPNKKFKGIITVTKIDSSNYRISICVQQRNRDSQSQAVRDIYESSD